MLKVMSSTRSAERLNGGGSNFSGGPTCSVAVPMSNRKSHSLMKFDNYLIAASPPGFEVLRMQSSLLNENRLARSSSENFCDKTATKDDFQKPVDKLGFYTDARVLVSRDRTLDVERLSAWERSYVCDNFANDGIACTCSLQNVKKSRTKKLQFRFADEVGLDLTDVLELTESSETPPNLLNCNAVEGDPAQPEFLIGSNLVLNFIQPAANYYEFRQKLERNFVSLENVIARDRSLFGTVRVQNTQSERSVFIRITFVSWKSFSDIHAKFVDGFKSSMGQYETFSFNIDVPGKCDDRIQFAVCFATGGREHWDSNNGLNYQIINAASSNCNVSTGAYVFSPCDTHDNDIQLSGARESDLLDAPYW